MRIALVSQEYPPERHGGIGAQNHSKAAGLAALGHSVVVLAHSATDRREVSSSGGIQTIRIPGYDDRMPIFTDAVRWLAYSVCVAQELASLHQVRPLDLIDFAEWGAEGYTFLLNRTEENHVPAVIQLHGPLVMFAHTMDWPPLDSDFFHVGTHMERTCVRLADAAYTSSQCSLDWCAEHYGLAKADVPLLHTGVDTNRFRPGLAPKELRPTIVFVGQLVENKGVFELVQSARQLLAEFPDLQVWMVGGGEAAVVNRLRELGRHAARPDFLQLCGFVPRDQLPRRLSRAHIFAAPSIYEGGPGFVYLEAMACGLPVIACAGSGAAEVVRADDTGLLVPPHDTQALTEALRRLLSDEQLRDSIGERARTHVCAEADSRVCLQRLAGFYESIIARRRPASAAEC